MDKQERWYADEIELHNQVIADVGANVGRLSQFFWDAGDGSNAVISIEPLPQNIKRIKSRITRSKAKNWSTEACAVSDRAGEIHMDRFHNRETGWNSVVLPEEGDPNRRVTGKLLVVQAKPLSDLAPEATVVKVDIEGHEYAVIDEALPRLDRAHTWAVELHMVPGRPLGDVIAQFIACDYQVFAATQRPGDPSGRWQSIQVTPQLQWSQIPVARHLADGDVFKMLHIIARRGHNTGPERNRS